MIKRVINFTKQTRRQFRLPRLLSLGILTQLRSFRGPTSQDMYQIKQRANDIELHSIGQKKEELPPETIPLFLVCSSPALLDDGAKLFQLAF